MSGVIAPASSGSSGLVDEPNFSQIRINLNIEYGDCRFEMNDQGRYIIHVEGNTNLLTTAVCEYSKYLPQLLAKGGTVMAVCYGLYKLGFSAGNFSRGSLEFELKAEPAKLATIRRQITKGRFAELLQDEVDAIIEEHTPALAHLKNFTIQSAKEVSMTETAKQSSLVFEAANLHQKEPMSHAGNHTHRSIAITNEFSCNPEWTCNLEFKQGKYFVVVNGQRVELTTTMWPLEKGLKQLLYCGGAPVLICYGLYKLGYDASDFTREGAGFKITTGSNKQTEEIQWLLRCGTFAHKLGSEIYKITQEHSDIFGNVNFTITSCSEVQEAFSKTTVVSESTTYADSSKRRKLSTDALSEVAFKSEIVADGLCTGTHPTIQDCTTQVPDPQSQRSTRSSGDTIEDPITNFSAPGDDQSATNDNENDPPPAMQADSVPTNQQKEDQKKPIKYHVGIFCHKHDKEKADRIKGHCDSLGYNTCIFDDWVGVGGEPRPKRALSFIKECLVLFWIASPQHHTGSYMEQYKIVAHDISIKSDKCLFAVVIPKEYLQEPCEKIIPEELMVNEPVKEDTKISARIKTTVKAVQASTTNPPPTSDSQNIPTTSGPPTDVPGTTITNTIQISGCTIQSLIFQTQGE